MGTLAESLLKAYPHIQRQDVLACLDYAASLAEEQVTPIEDWPRFHENTGG